MLWTLLVVVGIVSLTRPLGVSGSEGGRFNLLAHLWSVFNGRALVSASRQLVETPGFMIGLSLLSVLTLELEVAGYWCLKQAFSSAMDDYWLMRGFGFVPFMVVIAVANIARVLPYTFASVGIYEIVSVAMFRVFGIQELPGWRYRLASRFAPHQRLDVDWVRGGAVARHMPERAGNVARLLQSLSGSRAG